jgi:YidC/Oxa1 family membrane protein insertase
MDKKSIIGLVLIAGILVLFSIFAPRGEEEVAANDEASDQTEEVAENEEPSDSIPEEETASVLIPKLGEDGKQITDSVKGALFTDTISGLDTFIVVAPINEQLENTDTTNILESSIETFEEEVVTLETNLLILDFSTKGGKIKNVYVKDFRTYDDYVNERNNPLQLYDDKSTYGIVYNF